MNQQTRKSRGNPEVTSIRENPASWYRPLVSATERWGGGARGNKEEGKCLGRSLFFLWFCLWGEAAEGGLEPAACHRVTLSPFLWCFLNHLEMKKKPRVLEDHKNWKKMIKPKLDYCFALDYIRWVWFLFCWTFLQCFLLACMFAFWRVVLDIFLEGKTIFELDLLWTVQVDIYPVIIFLASSWLWPGGWTARVRQTLINHKRNLEKLQFLCHEKWFYDF